MRSDIENAISALTPRLRGTASVVRREDLGIAIIVAQNVAVVVSHGNDTTLGTPGQAGCSVDQVAAAINDADGYMCDMIFLTGCMSGSGTFASELKTRLGCRQVWAPKCNTFVHEDLGMILPLAMNQTMDFNTLSDFCTIWTSSS